MNVSRQTVRGSIVSVDRRQLLLGGGFALGLLALPGAGRANQASASAAADFGAYIQVTSAGDVIIVTPGAEMGQGVANSLPKIIAEEMDADWSRVSIRLSGADAAFNNPAGRQRNANSDAVMRYFEPLRRVGASARAMLVSAAAETWNVEPGRIRVAQGRLHHPDGKHVLGFGDVAVRAAQLPVPGDVRLKNPADFSLIGRDFPRKDIPPKVMGTAVFGIDVDLPDMLYAAVRHVPVAGAKLMPPVTDAAAAMPGVVKVAVIDNAVAVIAKSYWQAQKAVDILDLQAEPGDLLNDTDVRQRLMAGLDATEGVLPFPVAVVDGKPDMGSDVAEIDAAMESAAVTVEADFEVPYLAHATLEPMCCTALVTAERCEIWAPVQAGDRIPPELATITGLPVDAIKINRTYIGGGFGRKNERDFIHESVRIAQAVPGRAVKMIWSRQEDMRNSYYRPAFMMRTRAAADAQGNMTAWHSRIVGQPLQTAADMRDRRFADGGAAGGLVNALYNVGNRRIEAVEIEAPLRTGYWRSVSGSQNGFFSESVINEMADALGRDPIAFRKQHLADDLRSLAVLDVLADKSGWAQPLPAGQGRGVALGTGWGSRCAMVVEVKIEDNVLTVPRVVCAFDCGLQIDPDNIAAQMQGGIIFGLTAALHGKITLEDGVIAQSNYADYPMLTLASSPAVEVHLVKSDGPPGGVGEAGVPPVAPALAAAIFAANGKRIRRLPVSDSGLEVNA